MVTMPWLLNEPRNSTVGFEKLLLLNVLQPLHDVNMQTITCLLELIWTFDIIVLFASQTIYGVSSARVMVQQCTRIKTDSDNIMWFVLSEAANLDRDAYQ